jgi:hypothetical protein
VQFEADQRSETCPHCGTRPADWKDESGKWSQSPPFRAKALECGGCKEQAEYRESKLKDAGPGTYVVLEPFDRTE